MIFHLIEPDVWSAALAAGMYAPPSLAVEGFVHFSFADQVETTANRYYRDVPELVLLEVDPALLSAGLRVEASGDHGDFPHVYGPVQPSAVVAVHPMGRDEAGAWRRA